MVLKFVILKSSEPFRCLWRLPNNPISKLKRFHWLIKIENSNMPIILRKCEQKIENFIKKLQIRDNKILKNHSVALATMQKHTMKP